MHKMVYQKDRQVVKRPDKLQRLKLLIDQCLDFLDCPPVFRTRRGLKRTLWILPAFMLTVEVCCTGMDNGSALANTQHKHAHVPIKSQGITSQPLTAMFLIILMLTIILLPPCGHLQ
ncbi:hypothetical protein GOODEAATRI_008896 [Goodea atripinnis]|uniref:Uncharacterized protein n=1 Tax=Goodea atripinnis TaxID=208336 RepID=A0ABV0NSY1_9TELE